MTKLEQVNAGAEPTPQSILTGSIDRFLADGVHYRDLANIQLRVTSWVDWPVVWSEYAAQAEQRANAALSKGAKLTAGSEYARASLYYHFAQYVIFDDIAQKKEIHDRKNAVFLKAAPLLRSPMERVEIPFLDIKISGYFRKPSGISNPPVVICLGGFDTTKEDYLTFSDLCIERGLATYALDLPGQGETLFHMRLRSDFEQIVSAVVDYLETRPEVDATRIGIIGRSMGGFFAPKAAAVDKRLKALVCWGAMYDILDPHKVGDRKGYVQQGLVYMSGAETIEQANEFYKSYNLRGIAEKITCPVLIVHGGLDHGTPMVNVDRLLADLASNLSVETLIQPDAVHCNHNYSHVVRPAMADFLARNL